MPATTDRITDFAKRGGEAVTGLVSTGFDAWSEAFAALRPSADQARGLIDTSFGAAEKLLAVQKDLAQGVLDGGVRVAEKVRATAK